MIHLERAKWKPQRIMRVFTKILGLLVILVAAFYGAIYLWNRHVEGSVGGAATTIVSVGSLSSQMMDDGKQGRYDQAIQLGLQSLRNQPTDASIYEQLAIVCFMRAHKEQNPQERWVGEAISYTDKALAIDGSDPVNLLSAGRALETAGDASGDKRCSYYQRAIELSKSADTLSNSDHVTIGGQTYEVDPAHKEFIAAGHIFRLEDLQKTSENLSARVKARIAKAGCH